MYYSERKESGGTIRTISVPSFYEVIQDTHSCIASAIGIPLTLENEVATFETRAFYKNGMPIHRWAPECSGSLKNKPHPKALIYVYAQFLEVISELESKKEHSECIPTNENHFVNIWADVSSRKFDIMELLRGG